MGLNDRDYMRGRGNMNGGNFSSPHKYSTGVILFWVFVIMVGIYLLSSMSSINKNKVTDTELASVGAPVASSVPMPMTSVLSAVFTIEPHNPPFSIKTPVGGDNYYFKLKDSSTNTVIMTGFVRSGETLKTNVPSGTYYLETAGGRDWQGDVNLFGSFTQLQRSNEPLVFSGYSGHIVSMHKRVDGNFKTSDISKSSF